VILSPGLNVFRACAKLMTCCQLIDRWFVCKAKEGCHVRINKNHCECRVHGEGSQGLNPEIPFSMSPGGRQVCPLNGGGLLGYNMESLTVDHSG
jgi:hypothetical protein